MHAAVAYYPILGQPNMASRVRCLCGNRRTSDVTGHRSTNSLDKEATARRSDNVTPSAPSRPLPPLTSPLAHTFSTLPKMVLDSDLDTRKFSSKAMIAAARDYNGRTALLEVSWKQSSETVAPPLERGP